MTESPKRLIVLAMALLALMLLIVVAPALGVSGDYGVNTGASAASSNCGGTNQPACTLNVNGYGLTYSHTDSDGDLVYTFDDFECTVYIHPSGLSSARGSECDQYQPNS